MHSYGTVSLSATPWLLHLLLCSDVTSCLGITPLIRSMVQLLHEISKISVGVNLNQIKL